MLIRRSWFLKIENQSSRLKTITKATASGWKEPLLPHPLHSPVGGAGEGGAFSTAFKICLIKTWVTLQFSSKSPWNLRFYVKPLKKMFAEVFFEAFLILNLLKASCTSFLLKKSSSFYHPAVGLGFSGKIIRQICKRRFSTLSAVFAKMRYKVCTEPKGHYIRRKFFFIKLINRGFKKSVWARKFQKCKLKVIVSRDLNICILVPFDRP
jgi:hypothetical protein